MESVIFEDSPLAEYLEGQGEGNDGWTSTKPSTPPYSPLSMSFAPRGLPKPYAKFRRKVPSDLKLEVPKTLGSIARLHNTFSSALNSRLGRTENSQFLERFRYTIVASQLLNDNANPSAYNLPNPCLKSTESSKGAEKDDNIPLTGIGVSLTAGSAFMLVYLIDWARSIAQSYSRWVGVAVGFMVLLFAAILLYTFSRRQWLQYLRKQAIDSAAFLVASAENFDTAASAGLTLIQEVELVSRGYRISSPLPPISRLDEQTQTRRCVRLRRTLRLCIQSMLTPYAEAYQSLRPLAVEMVLEKYHDMYEISQSDIHNIEEMMLWREDDSDDLENLKALKFNFQKLHVARKLFLCSLLALDADGGKPDFARWAIAIEAIQTLASKSADATVKLDKILSEEDRFTLPPTPKNPLTPGHERMRAQMRKIGSLSHGIRELQAKLHILREESDRALDVSDEVSEFGSSLMVQYDSIGADLKALMQEWETGRAALIHNIDRNEHRLSVSSGGMATTSRSVTPNSPTGRGTPIEALRLLTGDSLPGLLATESHSGEEEVFEAIALPRQRSTLTRDERLAKMKEDRIRQAVARQNADQSTAMVKELQTVIGLRPRGRTTAGRLTTL